MICTGRKCIMQKGTINPFTCQSIDYCPEATPLDLESMREVVATLVSWAASEGLGYSEATRLLGKLYSGCKEDVRQ